MRDSVLGRERPGADSAADVRQGLRDRLHALVNRPARSPISPALLLLVDSWERHGSSQVGAVRKRPGHSADGRRWCSVRLRPLVRGKCLAEGGRPYDDQRGPGPGEDELDRKERQDSGEVRPRLWKSVFAVRRHKVRVRRGARGSERFDAGSEKRAMLQRAINYVLSAALNRCTLAIWMGCWMRC